MNITEDPTWHNGGWMQTHTNRKFYPMAPDPADISPYDIARGIAFQCRYNGHVNRFYSVAEHCVLIADALWDTGYNEADVIWGLLHDGTESYVGDMVRPLKLHMPAFVEAEDRVMDAICERFGLEQRTIPDSVRKFDSQILLDERAALKGEAPGGWSVDGLEPLGVTIQAWSPERAEAEWLGKLASLIPGAFK